MVEAGNVAYLPKKATLKGRSLGPDLGYVCCPSPPTTEITGS